MKLGIMTSYCIVDFYSYKGKQTKIPKGKLKIELTFTGQILVTGH